MLKEEIYNELKAIKFKIDIEVDCPQMVNYEKGLTGEQAIEWLEKLEALSAGSRNDIQGCLVWIYDSVAVELQPEGVEMPLKTYLFNVTDIEDPNEESDLIAK